MAIPLISAVVLIGENVDKKLLEKSFKSISWCDEIIKVDTSKIRGSFSEWRNEGMSLAKGKWVLYVDADEEVTQFLRKEIELQITNHKSQITAFAIPRRNFIFGQEFKYGGQYPDYQKRLFLRRSLKKWMGELHEEPEFEGELSHFKNPIVHRKNITVSQMIEKTNKWSEIESKLMVDAGHPKMNVLRFASAGFREFYIRFVKELCFLDGTKGIIYGIYQIYSRLISYSKLWEKQAYTIHT